MRTIEEIDADVKRAIEEKDVPSLRALVAECEEHGDAGRTARALMEIGFIETDSGSLGESVESFKKARELFEQIGDHHSEILAFNNLGQTYFYMGRTGDALAMWEEGLAEAEERQYADHIVTFTLNIGNAMNILGNYPQGLVQYQRVLALLGDDVERVETRALCHHNSGIVYFYTGMYADAVASWHKALAMYETMGSPVHAAMIQENLGNVQASLDNNAAALELYEKAIEVFQNANSPRHVANCYSNKALALISLGQAEEAVSLAWALRQIATDAGAPAQADRHVERIAYALCDVKRFDEAEELMRSVGESPKDDPSGLTNNIQVRALISEHHGDLEQAKTLLTESLMIANDHSILSSRMAGHEHLRDLARKMGDFEAYIEHSDAYQRLRDESTGHEATMKLAMIEKQQELAAIEQERERERAVLYSTLPKVVADRVIRGEQVTDHFDEASVIFMDIVGFTTISDRIPPGHVVHLLAAIFKVCDEACREHGVTKVKTIGDSYMAVAGVPEPLTDHAERAARAALDMLRGLDALELTMDPALGDTSWTKDVGEITVRIGVHCGSVVAGVVGEDRLQYDVWGDTVNVASRMESTGEPGRIQVSEAFAESLRELEEAWGTDGLRSLLSALRLRGATEVKGKGTMQTYWLEGA